MRGINLEEFLPAVLSQPCTQEKSVPRPAAHDGLACVNDFIKLPPTIHVGANYIAIRIIEPIKAYIMETVDN
jgi:hypothetical protein